MAAPLFLENKRGRLWHLEICGAPTGNMTKLLAPGLSQLKDLHKGTHEQLKALQKEQSLQMTEQTITAVSQLPILHLPPAPYVSLYHVQVFCSLASFSSIKPCQVLNLPEGAHGHGTERTRPSLKHSLRVNLPAWTTCLRSVVCVWSDVPSGNFKLLLGNSLFLRDDFFS